MKKWILHSLVVMFMRGITPPERCPQCKAPANKFIEKVEGEP